MSNLSQYRMSLALFSIGLLWLVSDVVGDDEKPGALDAATKSIVHRMRSAHHGNAEPSATPYELAVSEAEVSAPAANAVGPVMTGATEADFPNADAGDGMDEFDRPRLVDPSQDDQAEATPPDVGLIHK